MQLSAIRLPLGVRRLPGLRALSLPAIAPLRSGMARWLDARSSRERWALVALALVMAAALFVTLVWRPIEAARTAALADIERYDRIAARLRVAGPDVARMAAARAGTPSTTITESATKAGLTIQRIEPQGANIGVTLDAAGFDALVGWLAGLERDAGMRVVDLKLERRPDPGVVSAQVTLATT
jgi:general secretion pathway protein M